MESYQFLLDIALILFSTKLLGLFTRGLKMPQVVGSLLAGLLLGPAVLNILHGTDFIKKVSELGVIILMFTAGLETDVKELRRAGKASLIIAFAGVLLPLGGGFLIAHVFNRGDISSGNRLLQNVFIGVVLTATSVSITVETLRELGSSTPAWQRHSGRRAYRRHPWNPRPHGNHELYGRRGGYRARIAQNLAVFALSR